MIKAERAVTCWQRGLVLDKEQDSIVGGEYADFNHPGSTELEY